MRASDASHPAAVLKWDGKFISMELAADRSGCALFTLNAGSPEAFHQPGHFPPLPRPGWQRGPVTGLNESPMK
jgi:hypothetical protein